MARAKQSDVYKEPPRYFASDGWMRDFNGGVRPSLEELRKLIGFLDRGERQGDQVLDAKTRGIIARALTYLYNWVEEEEIAHRPGRGGKTGFLNTVKTVYFAGIINELHEKHGIKIVAAAQAVLDSDVGTDESRRKLQQSIERTYRKMKANGAFGDLGEVPETLVSKALARLYPPRKTGKK